MLMRAIARSVSDGLVTGAMLGVVHGLAMATDGMFLLSPWWEIALSLARWVGLVGLGGALVGAVSGGLLQLGAVRYVLPPRPAPFLVTALYLVPWVMFTAKEHLGKSGSIRITIGFIVIAAVVSILLALRARRRSGYVVAECGAARAAVLLAVSLVLYLAPSFAPARSVRVAAGVRPSGSDPVRGAIDYFRAREAEAGGRGFNLLLITIDTLRADRLGCYGYPRPTSPSIDSLAASGVLFENALCVKPKTSPSVATIMTGLYPSGHGVGGTMEVLSGDNETLAEILEEEGWETGAVITNGNLYPVFGFDQGFATFIYGHKDARTGADRAVAWLEKRRGEGKRWFLWVHFTDPHAPYSPPSPYDTLFLSESRAESGLARKRDLYDGEVRYTDGQVGRILRFLEEGGWGGNTLVVFTADHGESLGEHDYFFEHGLHPYEPSARVPLLFALPRVVPPGRVVGEVVSLVDLLPTVLDALGVGVPDGVAGRSFLAAVIGMGRGPAREAAVIEAGYGVHDGPGLTVALRRRETKYVHRLAEWAERPRDFAALFWSVNARIEGGLAGDEFYDLAEDPGEERNIIADRKEQALRDLALLRLHMASSISARESFKRGGSELDGTTYEALKSLGYLQ